MSGGHAKDNVIVEYIKWFFNLVTDVDEQINWIGSWGISRALYLGMIFIAFVFILSHLVPNLALFTLGWLFGTAPIWAPIAAIIGFWHVWIWYIQSLFLSGRHPILLEMKIPREITKSPRAMELAFALFSISSGENTFFARAWRGQVRPFFSFEIASLGGEIHFYIWTWATYKSEVEAAIYGQYPEVELHEVEDYASKFQFIPDKHDAFATEWRLESYHGVKGGDFAINAYQPNSYIDFELDKDPKEEFKVDPLSTVLEFLGSIGPNEQIWVQLVIRKCGNKGILNQVEEDHEWLHAVEHEVEKLRTKAAFVDQAMITELGLQDEERQPQFRVTPMQDRRMETMQRHMSKYPYEFGGRAIYIATDGHLHGPVYTGMRWLWKPMGNPGYAAQLRPRRWHCDFDYPWQDIGNIRWKNQIRRAMDAYRRRMFFHSPWVIPTNILTNETLATMWRPPSSTSQVPGLRRLPSKKSGAPENLPK